MRTKLGKYATARLSASSNPGILLNGELPLQPFSVYNQDMYDHIHAQRRRRRRYLKKRRLTEEEVDHLFPLRTYKDWLDGGAERDLEIRGITAQLKEEDDEALQGDMPQENSENATSTPEDPSKEATTITTSMVPGQTSATTSDESQQPRSEVDLGSPFMEMHFDSGTCAICIDAFEDEDIVRGLICGHVFHQDCLDPWLIKRKACCPMCKRDYYLKNNEDPEGSENGDGADQESTVAMPEIELRTIADRVEEILQRNPELEEQAKQSIGRYLSWRWRAFWALMGISKQDLINSAIASEDERRRANLRAENANSTADAARTAEPTDATDVAIDNVANADATDVTIDNVANADASETAATRDRVERMV